MGARRKKPGRRPRIDPAAKVAMLAALREGRRLDPVAEACGVTLQAFYSARRRDPVFAAAWRDAHALSAAAERTGRRAAEDPAGAERVVPNNRRRLQRRWLRHLRFDERRKALLLAHFAGSCDLGAAAAAAGVSERTVFNHRLRDPAFAEAFQGALEEGLIRLRAEAVRARLEAQERLRAAIEEAEALGEPLPLREQGLEFDRTMKLLARWERLRGPPGPRQVGSGGRPQLSFEEALESLERKLRHLDIPLLPQPGEAAAGGGGPSPA